jgi:hypothetical protein
MNKKVVAKKSAYVTAIKKNTLKIQELSNFKANANQDKKK